MLLGWISCQLDIHASQLDSSLGSNILTSTSALGKHVVRNEAGILETLSIYVSPCLLIPSFVDYKRRHLPFKNCGTKNSNGVHKTTLHRLSPQQPQGAGLISKRQPT